MGFTSFLHLAGFLSFPIRLKALDLGRSNRTGNFRPKYAPLKNFCWRIHRNPLFWDIGLSTTFFFRNFFAVKLWPEKTKGETKTADFVVLKDSTLSPGSRFCASLTAAPHGAGPWQQVYAVICWKEAQVSPRMALMRQVLSAPAPWREVPKLGHWEPPLGKLLMDMWPVSYGSYGQNWDTIYESMVMSVSFIYVGDLTSTGFRKLRTKSHHF